MMVSMRASLDEAASRKMITNNTRAAITKTAEMVSVHRKVVVRMKSGRRTEHEPCTADTVDHGRFAGLVHLAPQAAHMNVDQVGARIETVMPDFLEQHGARHDLPGMTHQIFQQLKLARQYVQHA